MTDDKLKNFARRISGQGDGNSELIPAATVVLLRQREQGMETLMLRKNSKIAFAGMWVFPGGRIDAADGSADEDMLQRARAAASRETMEEACLHIEPSAMHWFSHWTPPAMGNRRFATWFFLAAAPDAEVCIDQGEITESQWIRPRDALAKHVAGEIEIVPPTYVSLHYLSLYDEVGAAIAALASAAPRHYATHIGRSGDDLVAMWEGDAGYDSGDADTTGPRHRLRMGANGYEFDDSGKN